ncbi:uncharacterized protein LOC111376336 [Olea europaea var. sylvestris]|uniref:uncharacterized protein LOC111376336 n=1 Tax=Olea europaea var. sylvestris TaxID=158386 RepID=UPI000C1CD6BC|nr:uncharacterized protein LOC111376336 [Olea europaea var. sylvestris]
MNCSIKVDKIQAMKIYKKSQFLYNFVLYSLTTVISCSFICYPFWFPSMNYLFSVSFQNIFSFFFTAKFLFVIGNIIVIVLVREFIQAGSISSPSTDIYDEYISQICRSYRAPARSNYIHANKKKEEKMETEDKLFHAESKKVKICSGAVMKREKRKKEEKKIIPTGELNRRMESKQAGSNSSPETEIYDEYLAPANKKVQKDKMENTEDKILHAEKKKELKMSSGILKREKRDEEEENYIPTEELNRRVEAYIARVNRKRLLEAKSLVRGQ